MLKDYSLYKLLLITMPKEIIDWNATVNKADEMIRNWLDKAWELAWVLAALVPWVSKKNNTESCEEEIWVIRKLIERNKLDSNQND